MVRNKFETLLRAVQVGIAVEGTLHMGMIANTAINFEAN
jgi:hypothetical protein